MCDEKQEQRINFKFLVKLKKTPTECCKLLQEAYGGNSLSPARVFDWYKRFSEGRGSTEDDQRLGRPVTVSTPETVTKINQIVRADRQMSIRMIAEAVNADKETVRKILHEELHMTKVFLATLRERVRKKRPELWKNNSWILHQDNAPAHNALSVKQYLAGKRTPVLEHAPYWPDLAPCDFFLFPKKKSALKGARFESMEASRYLIVTPRITVARSVFLQRCASGLVQSR
ncbi:Hypothetical protein CINCED_3A000742 [Cinara cedri]|uniref:Mos1 transposase HTH domain-containing protein n=1 Tax=Cinara cedri TaxID=506608 RepID=A0A5E4MY03_9HEMI|nr:Hypothetical protein CINCED_3A000742 [Cinara cedri]